MAPGDDKGGRPPKGEEKPSGDRTGSSRRPGHDKEAKLRAILRAPEVVQQMYRADLIPQQVAATVSISNTVGQRQPHR